MIRKMKRHDTNQEKIFAINISENELVARSRIFKELTYTKKGNAKVSKIGAKLHKIRHIQGQCIQEKMFNIINPPGNENLVKHEMKMQ